ncbi:class I SAM-dependent methyltransferase [Nodosilinea sp. LEGE 07088]|uniref:class I SAM-dependent methyltransferase n=1 Tax=Nodosilinea sp. LEGE 07088 TaxID=2777968 RepID=UPI00188113F2|nr:class I SAM-dependent methyltransferase [Nodosilinea sp. LEGE 07088]MBE9139201.1 class I SAM-dependent methyltransferase [Nodosilinea sp. LEGE 07088]
MDSLKVADIWNRNAEAWTVLARQGYDVYRDFVNTPAFLAMLPSIMGLKGLDIGCGEGANTRELAELGASLVAIDVAPTFIQYAQAQEHQDPRGIVFQVASATELPFDAATFDFATAFMSLMDISNSEKAIQEANRVLKPGGFFQFSITHPCFDTPYRQSLKDAAGQEYAIAVGRYFEHTDDRIDEWMFSNVPAPLRQQWPKFRVPRFHRTLSEWLNLLIGAGFMIEALAEPKADDAIAAQCPTVADTQIVAYFLHVRCRKPLN